MQWHQARLGIPTASQFSAIVTPTGKATANAARKTYMHQLLCERLTGMEANIFVTPAMQRGVDAEPKARRWYEAATNRDVRQVGFAYMERYKGKLGASPDGVIDADNRGLEIKVPMLSNLIGLLLADEADAAADYMMQVQGNIWVCDAAAWDLVLYSPDAGVPARIIEIKRDDKLMDAFETHIPAFITQLEEFESRLRAMGGGVERPSIPDWAALPDDEVTA